MTPLQQQAIRLAQAGIQIFPCEQDGKMPATAHGFRDATCDVAQITRWWDLNPNFNIAICPEDAGQCVIDIDPGGEPTWIALLAEHGQHEPTYTVETPRGGKHLYFEGSLPPTVSKLGAHVDTRGRTSYVLVPPSIVNGKPYRVIHDRELAPVPSWIGTALAERSERITQAPVAELDTTTALARARNYVRGCIIRGSVAVSGCGGNDTTYRLAAEIRDYGVSLGAALGIVLEPDGWNSRCLPPWDESEIGTIFDHAYNYGQNAPGAWATRDLSETFRGAMAGQPVKPSKFLPLSFEEGIALPEPKWLVPGLIPAGAYVMIYGAPASFKSFIALDIGMRHAAKGEGMVFYAALEGLYGVRQSRSRAWVLQNTKTITEIRNETGLPETRVVKPNLECWRTMPGPRVGLEEEVQEFGDAIKACAGDRKVDLIILDTFSRAMDGLDENFVRDVSRFTRAVESLIEAFGCTVLVVHHTRREGDRERGSISIEASTDAKLQVIRKGDAVEVWVRRQKDAEEKPFPLTYRKQSIGGSLVFVPTTSEEHRDAEQDADPFSPKSVGRALAMHNSVKDALTTPELSMRLGFSPGDEATVRKLEKLAKKELRVYAEEYDGTLWWWRDLNVRQAD